MRLRDKKRQYAEQPGKRRNVYIYDNDYDYLAQIGNGYADGLRKAVEAHKALNAGQPTTDNEKGAVGDERGEG